MNAITINGIELTEKQSILLRTAVHEYQQVLNRYMISDINGMPNYKNYAMDDGEAANDILNLIDTG